MWDRSDMSYTFHKPNFADPNYHDHDISLCNCCWSSGTTYWELRNK
jgi:hypothetical protein